MVVQRNAAHVEFLSTSIPYTGFQRVKEKSRVAFRHKHIHNCITQSEASYRNRKPSMTITDDYCITLKQYAQ